MKLTVLIRRQRKNEPQPGYLKAFVLANGRPQGKDLLSGHSLSKIDSAICIADGKVLDAFSGPGKLDVGVPELDYVIDEGDGVPGPLPNPAKGTTGQ